MVMFLISSDSESSSRSVMETLAAKKILSGDVHAGDTLVLDVKDGEFVINTK